MKFVATTNTIIDDKILNEEFGNARQVGVLRVGESNLFFRSKMKQYYIPFSDIKRCYRRVVAVSTKMCCGRGELLIENLVVCDDEKELAVIQLPGTRAAKILMEDLKGILPEVDFSSPKRNEDGELISEGTAPQMEGAGA